MGSLTGRISKLARSAQGRKLTEKAQNYAQSPEGKRKIAEIRQKVSKKR